jgi:hypothetical protein
MTAGPADLSFNGMHEHLLRRTDLRRASRLEMQLAPGGYITDGVTLFRCISIDHFHSSEATVLLEDCMSLDVVLWTMRELSAARVRLVR